MHALLRYYVTTTIHTADSVATTRYICYLFQPAVCEVNTNQDHVTTNKLLYFYPVQLDTIPTLPTIESDLHLIGIIK